MSRRHGSCWSRSECMLNRMDSLERKQFEDFYAPITEEFYKLNLKGKELAEWKYQQYMHDICGLSIP